MAVVSPVIAAGSGLFEAEGRPFVVRLELPVSAAEMVAALYCDHDRLSAVDLESGEDVWRRVALVVVQDGLNAVQELAGLIEEQEPEPGCGLDAPGWLALCRRRVAEAITAGAGVQPGTRR
jgi:hypothetical protein